MHAQSYVLLDTQGVSQLPPRRRDDEDEDDFVFLESKGDGLLKDTTTEEKISVFHLSQRISTYLRGLMFATGAIAILLSAECLIGAEFLFTLEMRPLFLGVLTFIGLVNMICGLLLLAKD
jgi:hypothetical protein